MKHAITAVAAFIATILGGATAHAGLYTLTDLWAGGAQSLNDSGDVVGSSAGHAVLYHAGTTTNLELFGNNVLSSAAYGINASGHIAGIAYFTSGGPHAFMYDATNGMQDLGTLGGNSSLAYGINDSNQIVGTVAQPYIYSNGSVFSVPLPSGATGGDGVAINNTGTVVGEYAASNGNVVAPFLTIGATSYTFPALGNNGGATAVNASNSFVGFSDFGIYPSNQRHAFLVDALGIHDLGTLTGGSQSQAYGINDSGVVVGTSFVVNEPGHAVIYQDGALSDLNSLIDPGSGVTLAIAYDINNVGQIIANASNGHSYLLTPAVPEPSTTVFGIIGIAGLLFRRTRNDRNG